MPFLTHHWRLRRQGFSLVEICLSMLFILALVVILLTASGTFKTSRKGNLQSIASEIAKCEVEQLRNTLFVSITIGADVDIEAPCNADLSKLPTPNSAKRTIAEYDPPNPDIKQVTINITWTENNISQELKTDTLISENGL